MAAGWAGTSRRVPRQGPHGSDTTVRYPCLDRVHQLGSRLNVSATRSPGLRQLVELLSPITARLLYLTATQQHLSTDCSTAMFDLRQVAARLQMKAVTADAPASFLASDDAAAMSRCPSSQAT
ncbi:hypothetical protein C2S53_013895 [Perilla frutescens var. hirtella]|uniref:Uncharacterized protein n=1 Tax=Perilla frutescens var. hirtella TaxID=608512 RepID=A0AAD4J876_PERFH|nr:hypothetical protein C2S53_013895 [Perilla frutescens var. hirtella]